MAFVDAALGDLKSLDNIASNFSNLDVFILRGSIADLVHRLRKLRTFILCVRKLGNDMHLMIRTDHDNNCNNNSQQEGSLGFLLVRNLRTFIQCVRKLGNCMLLTDDNNNNSSQEGRSLGSLLVKIEEAVSRYAQQIHPYCLRLEAGLPNRVHDLIKHFIDDIDSFMEEIEKWYIILTSSWQQLISPTAAGDEVIAMTASVLDNLVEVHRESWYNEEYLVLTEPLTEKIKFLHSFIRFAMLRSVDHRQLEDMLNHVEALAVNAARISFRCLGRDEAADKELLRGVMPFQISVLLQKIKPIDRHTYATYTQALTSSKLSRKLRAPISDRADDAITIMKDFIYFLMSDLWEMLQLDTYPVVSVKDQLQVLLEGLRSLRTIFVKQPNNFDEKIKDFLGVLICDAGLIIFSLYQEDVKVDVELLDLLERIEHIQKQVEERDPKASTSNFSRTNGLGFVDHLIEYLEDVATSKAGSKAQSYAQTIKEELVFLRSVLVKILDLHNELEELHALWNRILQVAERAEFLIDFLVVGDISDSFSVLFDSIIEDISNIKTDSSNITPSTIQYIKLNKVTKKSSHVSSQSCASKDDEIVGFEDESTWIADRLIRGSRRLKIIAIVGTGGQGKTTLASKVYNASEVIYHFRVRAFCSISQVFDRRKALLELLKHIVTNLPETYFQMTEQDLAEVLRRHLKGKRYLIFLDDVWDIQVWNNLAESLPDDSNGSRIMLTSRLRDVAPSAMLDNDGPLLLRQLTNRESWKLLQRKLFHGKDCPPELHEIGLQIAENCKGLPLTIVIVAGLLATTEQDKWYKILESLRSGIVSNKEQCMNTVELSYKHLSDHLKPCFLYFGMFPEDQEVPAKYLIWLWIAEGVVPKTKLKSTEVLEDVAADYLEDLANRCLVLVAQRRSMGSVKACRVHDLLHDFCRTKAKEEIFLQLLRGHDELLGFNAPRHLRRLGIQSKPRHFKESRLFCPCVRSLLFFSGTKSFRQTELDISFVIRFFKLLKVLDIGQINLGPVFPSEIGLLVQLRYLAVQGVIEAVPETIGSLSFLETFILDSSFRMVSFPDTFWNLRKLRHIFVRASYYYFDGFRFAVEKLENSPDLCELESCSGAIIFSRGDMEKQMRKFPNVRKLKCKLHPSWDYAENCNRIGVPDFLRRLESLRLSGYVPNYLHPCLDNRIDYEFGFPDNLKRLTLSDFGLPWSKISSIGKLPNLEVLRLLSDSFSGEIWDMEEGEFSSLRFLKLSNLGIAKWTASDDQFPNLEKLVVKSCRLLKEIPSYALEHTPTLEMIQLSSCRDSLTSSVKQIQMNMGDSDLKILVEQELTYFEVDMYSDAFNQRC